MNLDGTQEMKEPGFSGVKVSFRLEGGSGRVEYEETVNSKNVADFLATAKLH